VVVPAATVAVAAWVLPASEVVWQAHGAPPDGGQGSASSGTGPLCAETQASERLLSRAALARFGASRCNTDMQAIKGWLPPTEHSEKATNRRTACRHPRERPRSDLGNGKPTLIMRTQTHTWKRLFFYGEVVGFLLAWVVGVVVTLRANPPEARLAGVEGLASITDLRGAK